MNIYPVRLCPPIVVVVVDVVVSMVVVPNSCGSSCGNTSGRTFDSFSAVSRLSIPTRYQIEEETPVYYLDSTLKLQPLVLGAASTI